MFHEKKVFLKFSWNSEEYSGLRVPQTWNVSKMRPQYRCFPANLGKSWFFSEQLFYRTPRGDCFSLLRYNYHKYTRSKIRIITNDAVIFYTVPDWHVLSRVCRCHGEIIHLLNINTYNYLQNSFKQEQGPTDLVTITEEILNAKLHFLFNGHSATSRMKIHLIQQKQPPEVFCKKRCS